MYFARLLVPGLLCLVMAVSPNIGDTADHTESLLQSVPDLEALIERMEAELIGIRGMVVSQEARLDELYVLREQAQSPDDERRYDDMILRLTMVLDEAEVIEAQIVDQIDTLREAIETLSDGEDVSK